MHKTLTTFIHTNTKPEFDSPRPDRLVSGNPKRTTWNHYEDKGVSSGLWECEVGAWRIAFADDKDEFSTFSKVAFASPTCPAQPKSSAPEMLA